MNDPIYQLENWGKLDFKGKLRLLMLGSCVCLALLFVSLLVALIPGRVAGAGLAFVWLIICIQGALLVTATFWIYRDNFSLRDFIWGYLSRDHIPGMTAGEIKESLDWAARIAFNRPLEKTIDADQWRRLNKESFWMAVRVSLPLFSNPAFLAELQKEGIKGGGDVFARAVEIYQRERKLLDKKLV